LLNAKLDSYSQATPLKFSLQLGRPLRGRVSAPWAQYQLGKIAIRFYESGGELDLNQVFGGKGVEGKRSNFKSVRRNSNKFDVAFRIGDALAANEALPSRRRKSRGQVWDRLAVELETPESTLRNQWSARLKEIYKLRENRPHLFPIPSSRTGKDQPPE